MCLVRQAAGNCQRATRCTTLEQELSFPCPRMHSGMLTHKTSPAVIRLTGGTAVILQHVISCILSVFITISTSKGDGWMVYELPVRAPHPIDKLRPHRHYRPLYSTVKWHESTWGFGSIHVLMPVEVWALPTTVKGSMPTTNTTSHGPMSSMLYLRRSSYWKPHIKVSKWQLVNPLQYCSLWITVSGLGGLSQRSIAL